MNSKSIFGVVALAALVTMSLGCSNQWRTAEPGLDEAELEDLLAGINTHVMNNVGTSSGYEKFYSLANDPNASIFFGDGPSLMGPLVSAFSVNRYTFLDPMFHELTFMDLEYVSIFFVTVPTSGGDDCALLINLVIQDGATGENTSYPHFYECDGLGTTTDGEFLAKLYNENGGDIVLRSFDVYSDGQLKDVIQLRVSDFDLNGDEQPNGKFSTLVRFGP
jgi:hypothetical protein